MARISTQQRRIELINAAVEVIAEHGVAGATTRLIADRAGSPLTMIHYCFGSKEDMYFAIIEHLAKVQFEQAVHVRPGVGLGRASATVMRQIGAWLVGVGAFAITQTELSLWMSRQDPDRSRKVYDMTVEVLSAKLREGLRSDDDEQLVDIIARIICAYGDGSVVHDTAYRDKRLHEACLESMAESLERLADAHRLTTVSVSR